jgi:hypothetical protein
MAIEHRASRDEAREAIAVAIELDEFIRNRLSVTAADHHRRASLLLGEPGLARLGGLTGRVQGLLSDMAAEPDWVESYRNWRDRLDQRLRSLD